MSKRNWWTATGIFVLLWLAFATGVLVERHIEAPQRIERQTAQGEIQ